MTDDSERDSVTLDYGDPDGRQPDAEPDRLAQPADAEQPPRLPFPVVGVGASAGGMEAFGEFLDAMRPDAGMAFVFVLHLPPDADSLLAEILARRTRMPVRQAEDGLPVEPDHVYVLCPGYVLTVRDGRLRLGPRLGSPSAANRPVDDLFRSLAEEQRERAVCVVLSGMGSNGTAGAQAVQAAGGLCIAQDPESAQYPSMPRHLIDAGYADNVLRPAELPEVLLAYAASPYARGVRKADARVVLDRGPVAPAAGAGREEPRDEVRRLRAELQGVIEELQTSNEELKAAHEEATSVNEELQSANEELRAVNSQLRTKMEELQAAASDLTSLLTSTDLAVLFLDTSLHIRRYTPAVKELFGPIPEGVGRPMADLARRFDDPHLADDCRAVLERHLPAEREVSGDNGRHYLRRATPYRTTDNRIDGVVLTFVDVSTRKRAEEALRAGEERLRLILESATDFAILTLDPDRVVTSWSPGAAAAFGYAADEIVGQSGDDLFTPADRAAGIPEQEADTARRDGRAADERWHLRQDGTRFYASGVVRPLRNGGGFVRVARDLTDRKRMEDELRAARDGLEERVAERTAELERAMVALEAEMARRRDLARRLASAQEDERRRVSRDLHDTVGQLLAGLALALRAVETSGTLPPPTVAKLAEARRALRDLGKEVHGLAVRLRPTSLDDVGLEAALRQLVSEWSSQSGVRADFLSTGLTRLPAEVETAVYRVVQEALTNVAKHAKAAAVSVAVTRPGGFVAVAVEDDGAGFDPATNPPGRLGLLGMRERVELVGGTLDVDARPGAGTTVAVHIPLTTKQGAP